METRIYRRATHDLPQEYEERGRKEVPQKEEEGVEERLVEWHEAELGKE